MTLPMTEESQLTEVKDGGQITIPDEIRRALSLDDGDTVVVRFVAGEIHLRPYQSVIARTAGMLRGDGPVLSAEELRAAAEQAIADAAIERMGR